MLSELLAQAVDHLRVGRPAEAIAFLRAADRLQPGNAGLLHDLGLACLECRLVPEAIAALQSAIAVQPSFADAHLRLGIAQEAAGELDAALAAYRSACALAPALGDAWFRAGDLLDSLGLTPAAIEAYRRACAVEGGTTLGRIAAAKALRAENRDVEAESAVRLALAADRQNAAARELLGNILADLGRFEEARACLLGAVDAAPSRAGSYYDIVRCRRIGPADLGLVARMRDAAAAPGLEPAQRSRVHLALGRAHDDLGDPEAAMRHYDAAQALRDTLVRFDLAAFEARVDRMIARFPADAFGGAPEPAGRPARMPPAPLPPTPVLIVGLPRSGTTLVEQILAAHPNIEAGGELGFWNEHGRQWDLKGPGAAVPDHAARAYLQLLRDMAPRASHVTDKMPLNLQWAGLVAAALPGAIIVHCRRRPIDIALSIHQTHFNPRLAFPTGGAALVGYMRATSRLAAHWRRVLPPSRFISLDYETLVGDPEREIRRVVEACGLPWHPGCLHPERSTRAIKTASKWQVRQPIYRADPERWRRYEPWLGELRACLDD